MSESGPNSSDHGSTGILPVISGRALRPTGTAGGQSASTGQMPVLRRLLGRMPKLRLGAAGWAALWPGAGLMWSVAAGAGPLPGCAEGELLVKLTARPVLQSATSPAALAGAEVIRIYPRVGWQLVRLPKGLTVRAALQTYLKMPGVAAVQPNQLRHATVLPNDPDFAKAYGLTRISAPAAWELTTGSRNVVVAVIDSGVFYDHEDLADNLWRNPGEVPGNGLDDDANGYVDDVYGIDARNQDSDPVDDDGHGTHCAGIIGAVGNNGTGSVGVNWVVQIMALKYSGTDGYGHDADLVECFEYILMMKERGANVRVTSNSYGGDEDGPAVKDAIDAAGNAGILNVFSAGNAKSDNDLQPFYPAGFASPSILSVASSDASDNLSSFSNFGAKTVHLAAPGSGIWTTGLGESAYLYFNGTSAACPHVAGAAALLAAFDPSLSVAQIKAALLGSVDGLPAFEGKLISNGRLNLARALQDLDTPDAPAIVTSAWPLGNRTPADATVTVTFSRPMAPAAVETAFQFTPSVNGVFKWSNQDRTVTLIPAEPLQAATTYSGRILGGAKDSRGITLDGNYNRLSEDTPVDDFVWGFRLPPSNDDFVHAAVISGVAGSVAGTNVNATKEQGEPSHAGQAGGSSVWHRWVAPDNGQLTLNTAGSQIELLLGVYTGNTVAGLTEIAVAKRGVGGTAAEVVFRVAAGVKYCIAVDGVTPNGYFGDYPAEGRFVLNWAFVPADGARLAIEVAAEGGLEIRWPRAAEGYQLETSPLLGEGAPWVPVGGVETLDREYVVRFGDTDASAFYRLRRESR